MAFILYAFLFCPTSERIPSNSSEWGKKKGGHCIYLARFKHSVLLEGQKTRASTLNVFLSHWQLSHRGCWITAVHTLVRTSAPLIPSWGCANVCEEKASSEQSRADTDFCRALHAKLSLELTSLARLLNASVIPLLAFLLLLTEATRTIREHEEKKKSDALQTRCFNSCRVVVNGYEEFWVILMIQNKEKKKTPNITNKYWLLKTGSCRSAAVWEVLQCLAEDWLLATTLPTKSKSKAQRCQGKEACYYTGLQLEKLPEDVRHRKHSQDL